MVWIPKYRKRVLQGKIAIPLKKLMYEACRMNEWWISEIAIREDHLHIVAQLLAKVWPRYREATRKQKTFILNEFIASTGYKRKYAI